jgi:hypothetical protein
MATVDRTIAPSFCPLCGTAKENDVFIDEANTEAVPKYFCGTVFWSFQKLVKVQGIKCGIIQKLRAANGRIESAFPPIFKKDLS